MNTDTIIDLAWKLWTVGLTLFVAFSKTQDRVKQDINLIKNDINGLGQKVARIETEIEGLPSHAELAQIHDKINAVAANVARMDGKVDANATLLQSIHAALMGHLREGDNGRPRN